MNIHITDATQGVKFKDIGVGTVFTDSYDDIQQHCISHIQMKMHPLTGATTGITFNAVYLDDGSQSHNDDEEIVYPINATLEVKGE